MRVVTGSGRGTVLLIHGLWFRPAVWSPWLGELDEAGYDAIVLSWSREKRPLGDGLPTVAGFSSLPRGARARIEALPGPPIVIGHGVGGAVAERLLDDGYAGAAISLAPIPGGYPAVQAVGGLLCRSPALALLSLRGKAVVPTFSQFRRTISSVNSHADARRFYNEYAAAGKPRDALLFAARNWIPAASGRPRRGPLLMVAGGKDELIGETSTALRHRTYRRRQPDALTDYKVFPGLDHTLSLGTQSTAVLFYCLDWLTAQNM